MVKDLIVRLEAAEFGNFGLDTDIHVSLGLAIPRLDGLKSTVLPEVTSSLDAALRLAERSAPEKTFRIDLDDRPRVWVFDKEDCYGTRSTIGFRMRDFDAYADAHTPALALCIAILRAREPQA